ncbi:hypothetical protein C8R44DRAFT_776335 [Mycena epipterygia]|nr:hypothetical protein C8R44DRAFT_776335 [Mycena epipterygia]
MDYDESSDILGSNSFPVRNPGSTKWSSFSKTAFFLALLLVAYVGAVRAWEALLKWREKSYRLSMRRRHGIPDNDHRPFNVAYAAVLRARREEEVASNRVHRVDVDQLYAEADQHAAPFESNIRQRKNQYGNSEPTWPNGPINGLPGRFNPLAVPDNRFMSSSNGLPSSSSHPLNFGERYNPNPAPAPPVVRFADEIEDAGLPRRGSLNNMNSPRKHQKRALEEYDVESDVPENPKKTRVEGDEFIDGDEDAEWLPRQKRGEKRVMREDDLDDEEEDVGPRGRRVRGKRARKVSLEKPDVVMTSDDNADDMDVDEEDGWRDDRPAARGKKRDAGSSFGGEEEEEGGDQTQKTRRKRRTVGKRKSDAATQQLSRGQKRDRDAVEEGSEAEEVVPETPDRSSRKTKKRGKKSKDVREDEEEGSVDEGSVSKGKGRPIGDEWESNGVIYKIGPNGQRLRQALVKKAARRFTMPLDSQHPDKNANLEVCIETWLTEEEYKDFKSRHLLAWQDSPKGTQEPESVPSTPAVAEAPSTPTPHPAKGKNLLWDSPASPFPGFAPSPAEKEQLRPKAHFRHSIAADLGGARVNPFDKTNALHVGTELAKSGVRSNGRRVVTVRETLANPGLSGLADSTNSIAAQAPLARRTFSKWEKQDLEAKAMMKMREANQSKVKEKELKEKLEREKKDREAAAAAAAIAPIPTISLTKPTESAKPPPISFTAPTPSAGPSTGNTTQAPSFSLGPTAAAPPKISFGPTATTDKPQQPTPNPFAPPASAASTPVSNPFAKPPASAPPPVANPNLFAPPSSAPGPKAPTPSFSFPPAPSAGGSTSGFGPPSDRPIAGAPARKPSQSPFPPASGNTASASGAGAPSFSFAPPAQNATPSAEPSSGGQSLLSRMGGAPKPAEAPAPAPPSFSFKPADQTASKSAFAAPQQPKPAAESAFSFKPADQSKPASAFAPPQQQQQQQQQQTTAQAPAPAVVTPPAPKFNFAFAGNKPAASSTPATSSSLTGALGSSDPKPSGSAFSFAAPKLADNQSTTPAGTPSFSFGPSATAGGSAFASPTPAPAAGESEQKKSAFGGNFGFGGNATPAAGEGEQKKSAFGGNFGFGGAAGSGAASPSPFGGSGNTSSVFGGGAGATKSAFGGGGFGSSAAKPAQEPAKATPVFGASAPPSNNTGAPSTNAAPASAPAFNFAFGNNASTTPAASPAASNPFAAKPSTTMTTTPQASAFGGFGGPSIFGTPAQTASTTPQGSPFGAAPASGPSAFGFGFGAPAAGQQK